MSNLIDIQNQIEKLQKQAIEIKSREFNKTVQEIRTKMIAFGITFKDLQLNKTNRNKGKNLRDQTKIKKTRADVKKTGSVPAKYRGPNDETWSGRGLTPRWLAALLAQGRKMEEFAIRAD
jgi:DNA-binding protein H-NS